MSNPVEASPVFDTGGPTNTSDRIYHILTLARVAVAATDTCLNIDLQKSGYRGIFEVIAGLANEALDGVEELEREAKSGAFYGPKESASP